MGKVGRKPVGTMGPETGPQGPGLRVPRVRVRPVSGRNERRQTLSRAPSGGVLVTVPADDGFHLIFQLEFSLLQDDFFELFRFREVVADSQVVQFLVQIVMLCGELAELLVGLQQLTLQLFEVCRHRRLLEGICRVTDGHS